MVNLAVTTLPVPPDMRREANEYVSTVWQALSRSMVDGFKGIVILNEVVGGNNRVLSQLYRRVKWALLWEALSWFVGVGEISAALKTLGVIGRVRAFAGILRVLGSPVRLAKLERFALLLGRARSIEPLEVLRYISHLPEADVRRVSTLLETVPVEDLVGARRLQTLENLTTMQLHTCPKT
jgi:hypothetical protein